MGTIIDPSEVILELGLSSAITEEERAIVNSAITRTEGAIKRYLQYDPVQRTRTEYYPRQDFDHQSRASIFEVQGSVAVLRRVAEPATSELQTQHIPIRSITSLRVDLDGRSGQSSGAFPADSEKTEGTDFWANYDGQDSSNADICRDGIIRSFGLWPVTPGTVRIVYVAGYTAAELHGQDAIVDASTIVDAAIEEAARRAKRIISGQKTTTGFIPGVLTGEKLGDYSYTIDTSTAKEDFSGKNDLLESSKEKLEDFVNWGWTVG
jgi:hypothetical protein